MYKRPSYNIKTTGVFTFKTKDKEYLLKSYNFERENDTEDSLEIQDELRGEIGSIRIKNSAWNKLAKGETIIAKTSKSRGDISGRLTRIDDINNSDKYAEGGVIDADGEIIKKGYKVTNGRGLTGIVKEIQTNGLLYIQWTSDNGEETTDLTSDNDPEELYVLSEYEKGGNMNKFAGGGGVGNDKMKVNITKNEFQVRKDDSSRVFHWYEGNIGDYTFAAETDSNGINGINKDSIYNLYISKVGGGNIARYNNKWEYKSRNSKDGIIISEIIEYIDSISDKKDGEPKKFSKGGGIGEIEVPLRANINGYIYEVIGVNHKLNKVRAKNFSSGKVIEMPINKWIIESFERGTPASFMLNGREVSGEVVLRNGQPSISLYKDDNYAGDTERIVPMKEIVTTLKPFMKKQMFGKGGGIEDVDDFIENVKEMHESIDYVVLKDGTKVNGYDLMEKGGDMNEYSKGGNVIERRYVNKDEDYETRYAKDKPSRMGYKYERKFAVGGEIGNTVSFKGDYGTPRSGVVKEKRGSSYIVSTDDGDRLVDSYEVISFSETPIAKKKRFGFFEGGGEVDTVSFNRVKSNFKNNLEIFNGEVVTIGDDKFKIEGNKFYIKRPNEDWTIFRIIKGEMFAGGGEIENKIEKLKKVVSSKMLPESVKAKAQAEIDKLEKELHESKETKAEEKAEHKAGGKEYKSKLEENLLKELNRLQRDLNSSRLQTYNEGDNSEEEKARQRERTSKIIRMNEVLALLNEIEIGKENKMTGESEGERKAGMDEEKDYIEAKTKALEKSLKDKTISETQRKRDEKELALFKGAEAKKPTTRKAPKSDGGDIKIKLKDGYYYNSLTAEVDGIEFNGYTLYDSNDKVIYKSPMIFDNRSKVRVAVNKKLAEINKKAPVKKAVVKKTEVKGDLPKSKFEIGDKIGVSGHNEVYEIKDKSYRNNIEGELTWVYYLPEYSSVLVSEKNLKVIPKPKADHKKLVAKLKAKKGDKGYDNRASINASTGERYKRSESSDKKREAKPLGKRISEDGSVYYENRLNRGDLSKKDKFEDGGEVKGSDWGLNLNW